MFGGAPLIKVRLPQIRERVTAITPIRAWRVITIAHARARVQRGGVSSDCKGGQARSNQQPLDLKIQSLALFSKCLIISEERRTRVTESGRNAHACVGLNASAFGEQLISRCLERKTSMYLV